MKESESEFFHSHPLPEAVAAHGLEKCLNNLNDMIIITEAEPALEHGDYKIVWANEVFYSFHGYEPAEVIGNSPKMLQGSLTTQSDFDELRKALKNWEKCRVQTLNYKKDGSTYWVEFEVAPISNDKGFYTHWISTQRDITARKKIEQNLIKRVERHELAFEGANVGLWDWDILTSEVYYSQIWKSMLGYEDHEIPNILSEWTRLLHPDDHEYALSKADAFINNKSDKYQFEFRLKHKDGHYVDILSHAFGVGEHEGKVTRLVGTHVDITARKQAEQKLLYQSSHDKLTDLVNRREFELRAERLLSSVKDDSQQHALCYMDLDQFKVVNDTCGHSAGDELLRQLGSLLQKVIRERDTLARLGGDEFAVLMEHCSIDNAHRAASAILSAVQEYQFIWEGHSFRISVSIGLVPIVGPNYTLTSLLKDADVACYMAKDNGRNRIHAYRPDDKELSKRHGEMQWVNRIQRALDENRFCFYVQRIQSIKSSNDIHYELLIRMLDDKNEIILPGAFLPSAERYNLITLLDRWVVENVFCLLQNNQTFLEKINLITINLSGQSLGDTRFLNFVISKFQEHDIDGNKICFEITETAAISQLDKAETFILELKKLGCNFALDDFGSGVSSYSYLKHLPVNYLKIDGVFVKDIIDDKISYATVKSINEIGHVIGMQTIAEFVENDQVKNTLKEIGVNYIQGYGIHKPEPLENLL